MQRSPYYQQTTSTMSDQSSVNPSTFIRIPELDGIRGIAILLVVIWHYFVSASTAPTETPLAYVLTAAQLTWSGVDLFFVLSGFLIGGILLDNKNASNYFKVFYIRRITRILPLYFLWLLLFLIAPAIVTGFVPEQTSTWLFGNPLPFWSYATFTQNIVMILKQNMGPHWLTITWSLAVEEQFYLTLPLLIRIIPYRQLPYYLISTILLVPVARLITSFFYDGALVYNLLMPFRLDALFLGVLAAYIYRSEPIKLFLSRRIRWLYGALTILLAGTTQLMLHDLLVPFGYSWLALLYTCFLLIAVLEKRGVVSLVTRFSGLRQVGLLAYGIYLLHEAINGLTHGILLRQSILLHTLPDAAAACLSMALTLGIAFLSWNFFEKHFVTFGHQWKYHRDEMAHPVLRDEVADMSPSNSVTP
jgi:peptidoglycan/LPS O-acetylase OafA/YrhL